MSEWIELNLPYYYHEDIKMPKYPDLTEEARKHFGKTPDEVLKSLKMPGEENKYNFEMAVIQKYDKYRMKMEEKLSHDDNVPDDFYKKLNELIGKSKDKDIQAVLSYKKFSREYDDWVSEQPASKKWSDKVDKLSKKRNEKIKTMSFCGLGLNKPGVLIEVEHDGATHQYLLGDINCSRGVCDDCVAFEKDAIVKRYRIVWSEDKSRSDSIDQREQAVEGEQR